MKSAMLLAAFLGLIFATCLAQAVRQPSVSELRDDSKCDTEDIGVGWQASSGNGITLSFFDGCEGCRASDITYNCGEVDPQLSGAVCNVNNGAPLSYGQFAFEHLSQAPFVENLRVLSVTYDQCEPF